jgi:hypothetical protein
MFTARYELNLYIRSGPLIVPLGEGNCTELSRQSPSLQRQERLNNVLRVMQRGGHCLRQICSAEHRVLTASGTRVSLRRGTGM